MTLLTGGRTRRVHRVQLRSIHWLNSKRVRELKKMVENQFNPLTRTPYV